MVNGQPTGTKSVQIPRLLNALPTPRPSAFCAPRQVEQVERAVGRASPARHGATALLERLDVVILPRHTAPRCTPTAAPRPTARRRSDQASATRAWLPIAARLKVVQFPELARERQLHGAIISAGLAWHAKADRSAGGSRAAVAHGCACARVCVCGASVLGEGVGTGIIELCGGA
jgi:hypothetical protein